MSWYLFTFVALAEFWKSYCNIGHEIHDKEGKLIPVAMYKV